MGSSTGRSRAVWLLQRLLHQATGEASLANQLHGGRSGLFAKVMAGRGHYLSHLLLRRGGSPGLCRPSSASLRVPRSTLISASTCLVFWASGFVTSIPSLIPLASSWHRVAGQC